MYLNITTTAGCRGKCVYCPQDLYQSEMQSRPRFLTAVEFTQLLPAMQGIHFDAFSFGGFSEPFDNPEMIELLDITSRQSNVERIHIYTNGEAVSPEIVERMSSISISRFDVSCHGFDADLYRRTRNFIDPEKVRSNLSHLLEHHENIQDLVVSVSGDFVRAEELDELRRMCADHNARLETRVLHSRAGLLSIGACDKPRGAFRCAKFDFEKPVLVPGGDLSLCCQDFSLQLVLGNLHHQSLQEILDHSQLRRHILDVAAGKTIDPSLICYQCEFCVPLN